MIELTQEQRQAVKAGEPISLVDPETNQTFVLLRSELYERIRGLLYNDSEFDIREAYAALDDMASKAGWDDPAMDIYNDFAPEKS